MIFFFAICTSYEIGNFMLKRERESKRSSTMILIWRELLLTRIGADFARSLSFGGSSCKPSF